MVLLTDAVKTEDEFNTVLARLTAKYEFQPITIWRSRPYGFVSSLSRGAVAAIRCEPEIKVVEENFWFYFPAP